MTPDLTIVLVNYNTRTLLLDCLRGLHASVLSLQVIVVDNASSDGSVEAVRAQFPDVVLICNEENTGFARANNQGIRLAQGRHVLLLNTDTVTQPGALQALVTVLDDGAAVAAPMLLNADGSIQPSCGVFPTVWTEFIFQSYLYLLVPSPFPYGKRIHPLQRGPYQRHHRVDWATGAALAARRDVFETIGLLDEEIFMYGEDLDWCFRAQAAGFPVEYVPAARITHLKGGSTSDPARWIEDYTQAALRFFERHRPSLSLRAVGLLTWLGSLLRILIFTLRASERVPGYRRAARLGWQAFTSPR